jgi:hypothetical protein
MGFGGIFYNKMIAFDTTLTQIYLDPKPRFKKKFDMGSPL